MSLPEGPVSRELNQVLDILTNREERGIFRREGDLFLATIGFRGYEAEANAYKAKNDLDALHIEEARASVLTSGGGYYELTFKAPIPGTEMDIAIARDKIFRDRS